jgi:hypothetical protein
VQGAVFYPLLGTLGILIPQQKPLSLWRSRALLQRLENERQWVVFDSFLFLEGMSGGCARAHPVGVALKALEGWVIPLRAYNRASVVFLV